MQTTQLEPMPAYDSYPFDQYQKNNLESFKLMILGLIGPYVEKHRSTLSSQQLEALRVLTEKCHHCTQYSAVYTHLAIAITTLKETLPGLSALLDYACNYPPFLKDLIKFRISIGE